MAIQYLAIIGKDAETTASLAHHTVQNTDLKIVCLYDNLGVLVDADDSALPLTGGNGALIGHLFSRQDFKPIRRIDENRSAHIVRSQGQSLISGAWGGYVAILRDGHQVHILRDPSGGMPCYYLEQEGATIVASDVGILLQAGFLSPEIDWSQLAHHLFAIDLRATRTPLKGVAELLAGFRLSITAREHSLSSVWSPWDHVRPEDLKADADVSGRLRMVISQCLSAWAEAFDHVLLGVSGGLDSSVIAAELASSGTDLTCLTMATHEAGGDERRYARALTTALDLQLEEAFHRIEDVDLTRSTSAHLPRPVQYAFGQSENATKFRLAHERNVDAFFSGIGGDNVFCFMSSATPIVDRFVRQGPGPAWQTVMDICHLTECTIWEAVGAAARRAIRPARYQWHGHMGFLNPDTIQAADIQLAHPWLDAPRGALAGKAVHIAMLARIQGTIDGFHRTLPPQILPLLSQPIVETCLSIPTWAWCAGGQNRSVVRQAYRDRLPDVILHRRSKGGPASFAYQVIASQKKFLRGWLGDGMLSAHGLLDLPSLNAVLTSPAPLKSPDYMHMLALAEAEAWCRHWSGQRNG